MDMQTTPGALAHATLNRAWPSLLPHDRIQSAGRIEPEGGLTGCESWCEACRFLNQRKINDARVGDVYQV